MARMTKQSVENLKVADQVRFFREDHKNNRYDGILVEVSRKGNRTFLHSAEGIMVYPSVLVARRSVRRIRPDLEPTEI